MQESGDESRKPRRYRWAEGDAEIIRWFSRLCYLTAEDLQFLIQRHKRSVWHRLTVLHFLGYIRFERRHPKSGFIRVWFLTQKGWNTAQELGFTAEVIGATDEKQPTNIPHDLLITDFIVSLIRAEREGVIRDLGFTRIFRDIYYRWDTDPEARVNPDAAFWFKRDSQYVFFFLEMERSDETGYDGNGKSERIRKMERYASYPLDKFDARHNADDFFVLVLLPTVAKTLTFIGKLRTSDDYRLHTRKFWAADFSAIAAPIAKTYMTPKDEAISLIDAANFK